MVFDFKIEKIRAKTENNEKGNGPFYNITINYSYGYFRGGNHSAHSVRLSRDEAERLLEQLKSSLYSGEIDKIKEENEKLQKQLEENKNKIQSIVDE
jgi:hypothetical protein